VALDVLDKFLWTIGGQIYDEQKKKKAKIEETG
jgi:hypothetical protein